MRPVSREAYQLLHDGILAFGRAERAGLRVDLDYCERSRYKAMRRAERHEDAFRSTRLHKHWEHVARGRAKLTSNDQLAHLLYTVKRLQPPALTEGGKGAVDEDALAQLGLPELGDLIRARKLRKMVAYLDALAREQVGGVVHPFFDLHTARTYRSSSSRPNWQNLPVRDDEAMSFVRGAVRPRPGRRLLDVDYGGIEVCMACVYTEDPQLIEDVLRGDMHRDEAVEIYMLDDLDKRNAGEAVFRQGAKNGFVFPEFYGSIAENCVRSLLEWAGRARRRDGTPGLVHLQDRGLVRLDEDGRVADAAKFAEHVAAVEERFWNVRYKVYTRWKRAWWERYQKRGYIELKTGFRCSGVMSRKDVINYPMQGTAFHCLLWSFVELDRVAQSNWRTLLLGQIHDDVLSDVVPEEMADVVRAHRRVMTEDIRRAWPWITIPLRVEMAATGVDRPWSEKKPLDEKGAH